mmetsp:Transcript_123545/g.360779  ORF Transcript_123545/g.360779 Transcript_123545/m.360779 type:complete len:273 (-) Transcript_123545:796-1614(-)
MGIAATAFMVASMSPPSGVSATSRCCSSVLVLAPPASTASSASTCLTTRLRSERCASEAHSRASSALPTVERRSRQLRTSASQLARGDASPCEPRALISTSSSATVAAHAARDSDTAPSRASICPETSRTRAKSARRRLASPLRSRLSKAMQISVSVSCHSGIAVRGPCLAASATSSTRTANRSICIRCGCVGAGGGGGGGGEASASAISPASSKLAGSTRTSWPLSSETNQRPFSSSNRTSLPCRPLRCGDVVSPSTRTFWPTCRGFENHP